MTHTATLRLSTDGHLTGSCTCGATYTGPDADAWLRRHS